MFGRIKRVAVLHFRPWRFAFRSQKACLPADVNGKLHLHVHLEHNVAPDMNRVTHIRPILSLGHAVHGTGWCSAKIDGCMQRASAQADVGSAK